MILISKVNTADTETGIHGLSFVYILLLPLTDQLIIDLSIGVTCQPRIKNLSLGLQKDSASLVDEFLRSIDQWLTEPSTEDGC